MGWAGGGRYNYFPRTPDETEINSFVRAMRNCERVKEGKGMWGRKNTGKQQKREKRGQEEKMNLRKAAVLRAEISAALHLYLTISP